MKKQIFGAAAVIVAAFSLAACSSSSDDTASSKASSSSKVEKKNETISQNKKLRTNFDKIKVGELSNHGAGGDSLKDVQKLFGKPTSTTSTKVDNYKVKSYSWTKDGVDVSVSAENDKVVSKVITGFKWGSRDQKLTLKAYNSIADGTSYEEVVKKYNEPDGLDESLLLGQKTVTATWFTGIKGDSGAYVSLTFENDKLTSKMQSDLK